MNDDTRDDAPVTPPIESEASPETKQVALLGTVREFTTTGIALAIAGIALSMLWTSFKAAAPGTEQKEIMLQGLAILGTVMGYYFGRVPTERRAEAAEGKATKAEKDSGRAMANAQEAERKRQVAEADSDDARETAKRIQPALEAVLRHGQGELAERVLPAGEGQHLALAEVKALIHRLETHR